jgi:hypothetical protein
VVLSAQAIKIGTDLQAAHEDIVSHVVGQPITITFWLIFTQIALYGYFSIARHIACETLHKRSWLKGYEEQLTSAPDTYREAYR